MTMTKRTALASLMIIACGEPTAESTFRSVAFDGGGWDTTEVQTSGPDLGGGADPGPTSTSGGDGWDTGAWTSTSGGDGWDTGAWTSTNGGDGWDTGAWTSTNGITSAASDDAASDDAASDDGSETGEPELCGDGEVQGSETCDDANLDASDGCDDQCQTCEPLPSEELETGYCETADVDPMVPELYGMAPEAVAWQECCIDDEGAAACSLFVDGIGGLFGAPVEWTTGTFPIGAHSDKDKKKDPTLTPINKPSAGLPDPWAHPPATKMDGKCGITAVSNLARFYGVEKDPKDIDLPKYRSWGPGLRRDQLAWDVQDITGEVCDSKNLGAGDDPLKTLRDYINAGKPVAIQYMMGASTAHWVIVTGVRDTPGGPVLTVQSWGTWYEVKWSDLEPQWKRGYGGDYPHVVCKKPSPKLPVNPPPAAAPVPKPQPPACPPKQP